MTRLSLVLSACACAALACTPRPASQIVLRTNPDVRPETQRPTAALPPERGLFAADGGGRPITALEAGSTLHVGMQSLRPSTLYEIRLTLDDGRAIAFARASTDRRGVIEPFPVWYEAGVVGCSVRRGDLVEASRFRFRTFEDAERALSGHMLAMSAHAVPPQRGRISETRVEAAESEIKLPLTPRRSPMLYPSDSTGCLSNAGETGQSDMFVSGRNFQPGEMLEVSVVRNQRGWYVGDVVTDVTGAAGAAESERVTVGSDGRFTARVWPRSRQVNGAFDIIARRLSRPRRDFRLDREDIASFARETAYLLFLTYPPGGPHMDIAGRPITGSPYFEFADAFAQTADPVWGAVDPTYVPAGHPGGTYAAYYVVNHKTDAQWLADNTLTDVSNGIEIHAVKSGCVNGTDVIIWNAPLNIGQYDVVVEFGSAPANTAASFSGDGTYDPAIDFLDGAAQIGFEVARDPYELGPVPVGNDSYSQDDFFPTLGAASNVDLRAVVRYPAVAPGVGTAVAAGTHPLFIIEHGNHSFCRVAAADHGACPVAQRVPNHQGYMRLLDILASHGIIAVSIDAYDLTGPVPQWTAERGALILKHIELWSHMNNTATFGTYPDFFAGRFGGKVDMSRIGISGHSRGGEASVSAYLQNVALPAPFSITSVSSIAPVDHLNYILPAIPYFVILPSSDCDVSDLGGQRIYDRAGSGVLDATTKSAIDVYGANHNFFNTVWAADGDECGGPGRQDYIAAASQQKIGEAYLAAFHRADLLGAAVYDNMLRNALVFPTTTGFKIYGERHETNHAKLLDGSSVAALVAAGGATLATASNPAPHSTSAIRVGWSASGASLTFTVPMGQRDASTFEVLSFRVAQTTSASNPANTNQNVQVELQGGGITRAVYVGQFDIIPPRYPHLSQTVMTTVRIPLHSFIMNNSGLTLNNVDTIRFKFFNPTTGELYVDDVEFSR